MMVKRFPGSAFLLLFCLLARSDGLTIPKNVARQAAVTRCVSSPKLETGLPCHQRSTTAKIGQPSLSASPLFSHGEANDDTIQQTPRNRFWKTILWKLSALFVAAAIFFAPAPAHARDGGGTYFTPEMEVSVATLAEKREEVSFWYPEMEQDSAREQEEQQQQQQSHAKQMATSSKNRGGHIPSFSMELIENDTRLDRVSIPLLVMNSLVIVAAALMRQEDTAESLRQRFSSPGKSSLSPGKLKENLKNLLLSGVQKWKMVKSTLSGITLAANAGLGLGLEEANELLKEVPEIKSDIRQYEGFNDSDIVYQFDYDAVDALLSNQDGSSPDTPRASSPLEIASKRLREESVNAMMEKAMLHRSEHQDRHPGVETTTTTTKSATKPKPDSKPKYGLCRSSSIDRFFGGSRTMESSPARKSSHAGNHIMLQRSSRKSPSY